MPQAPHLLHGLKGEGELALDGPRGAQHIQDVQEVSILQRGMHTEQPGSARQGQHSARGRHSLSAGPPSHRRIWGWQVASGQLAGAGTEQQTVSCPQGKQADVSCSARSLCVPISLAQAVVPSTVSHTPHTPPIRLSTLLMTVRMANSFSVGSPASERGAS